MLKTSSTMAAVLILLICGYGLGAEERSKAIPWSKVHYDSNPADNTSKCDFPSWTERARAAHRDNWVNCSARFIDPNCIIITIKNRYSGVACVESIDCTVRDGMFNCDYKESCIVGDVSCLAERQELILDKKNCRRGEVITGKIDCEFSDNYSSEADPLKEPIIIKGVFRAMLE
jgi:hypothetical protein